MANQELTSILTRRIQLARDTIATFQTNLKDSPGHSLEWSDSVFRAAGEIEVFSSAHKANSNDVDMVVYNKHLEDHILVATRNPARSTSPCCNLMAQHRLAATAELVEILRDNV